MLTKDLEKPGNVDIMKELVVFCESAVPAKTALLIGVLADDKAGVWQTDKKFSFEPVVILDILIGVVCCKTTLLFLELGTCLFNFESCTFEDSALEQMLVVSVVTLFLQMSSVLRRNLNVRLTHLFTMHLFSTL